MRDYLFYVFVVSALVIALYIWIVKWFVIPLRLILIESAQEKRMWRIAELLDRDGADFYLMVEGLAVPLQPIEIFGLYDAASYFAKTWDLRKTRGVLSYNSDSLCLTLSFSRRNGEINRIDFSLLEQRVYFDLSLDDDKKFIITIRSFRMKCSSYARLHLLSNRTLRELLLIINPPRQALGDQFSCNDNVSRTTTALRKFELINAAKRKAKQLLHDGADIAIVGLAFRLRNPTTRRVAILSANAIQATTSLCILVSEAIHVTKSLRRGEADIRVIRGGVYDDHFFEIQLRSYKEKPDWVIIFLAPKNHQDSVAYTERYVAQTTTDKCTYDERQRTEHKYDVGSEVCRCRHGHNWWNETDYERLICDEIVMGIICNMCHRKNDQPFATEYVYDVLEFLGTATWGALGATLGQIQIPSIGTVRKFNKERAQYYRAGIVRKHKRTEIVEYGPGVAIVAVVCWLYQTDCSIDNIKQGEGTCTIYATKSLGLWEERLQIEVVVTLEAVRISAVSVEPGIFPKPRVGKAIMEALAEIKKMAGEISSSQVR